MGQRAGVHDDSLHFVPLFLDAGDQVAFQIGLVEDNLDTKFFGYAAAEKLGIASPRTVVLPNKSYVEDVTAESLRNLWPVDFDGLLDYVGAPCIMKPAFGGGWKNVHKIHSLDELLQHYNDSGTLTLMLQEFISWDVFIRIPTVGRRWVGLADARRAASSCRRRR